MLGVTLSLKKKKNGGRARCLGSKGTATPDELSLVPRILRVEVGKQTPETCPLTFTHGHT